MKGLGGSRSIWKPPFSRVPLTWLQAPPPRCCVGLSPASTSETSGGLQRQPIRLPARSPRPPGPALPRAHPQPVTHPALNLRGPLFRRRIRRQAPPQPATPPQVPPPSRSRDPGFPSGFLALPRSSRGRSSSHAHSLSRGPISTQSPLTARPSPGLASPLAPAPPKATPPAGPAGPTSTRACALTRLMSCARVRPMLTPTRSPTSRAGRTELS